MARTRVWEASGELHVLADWDLTSGGSISATARTGAQSLSLTFSGGSCHATKYIPGSLTQFQYAACCYYPYAPSDGALMGAYRVGAVEFIRLDKAGNAVNLYVNGVLRATWTDGTGAWIVTGFWRHWGIDAKIDPAAGWVVVYREGVEILRYEGNTGNTALESVNTRCSTFGGSFLWDDCFLDDTAGEAAAAPVPDHKLYLLHANGNGNYSAFVGQDGNSVDNYLNVDDTGANDGDTSYNESMVVDARDSYALTTQAIPANWVAYGVRGLHVARRTDASVLTQAKTFLRLGGVDLDDAAAQTLSTNYTDNTSCLKGDFQTAKPGGGAWDQAAVDALEVGIQAKGPF